MEKGSASPSSWAKTQVSPHATALLRLRRVWQAEGGAVAHAVVQVFWRLREVDVILFAGLWVEMVEYVLMYVVLLLRKVFGSSLLLVINTIYVVTKDCVQKVP